MDRYERERFVGRGACGSAFVCRRISDSKPVVIKEIAIEMNDSDREATLNEIKVLSMLHHPNIIEYLMSYFEEEEIGHLFAQIVLPLHKVHSSNILHRDLKSKNIFLTGSLDHVKIGDFGISKILKSKAYTVVGTPSYISPELCEGKPYNYKSDVWSLGCVLYEMCSLKRAFEAPNLPALVLKIMRGTVEPLPLRYSSGLRQLISSMLALNPVDRPDLASLMCHHWLAPHIFRLPTILGALPCTSKPPRPPSAARNEDLRISLRESSFRSSRQKSLFATGSNTTLVTGRANRDKADVDSFAIADHDASDLSQVNYEFPCMGICLGYKSDDDDQVFGVTKAGKVFHWKFRLHQTVPPKLKVLHQLISIRVKKVATGADFMCLLTDRGILLTAGSGAGGCLGHGNEESTQKPKIVDALLGEEVTDVACGRRHVVAVTSDDQQPIFTWGTDSDGCLGLGKSPLTCQRPREADAVPFAEAERAEKVVCGHNVSAVVTTSGRLLVSGKYHMTTHSTFREHSPNFIGVSDVGFGRDYAVFLSTESRVYFNKFGSGHEMVELVTPKVKLVPIL